MPKARSNRLDPAHLERLRTWRPRVRVAPTISNDVAAVKATVSRCGRRLGEFIEAWEAFLPGDLCGRTRVASYRAGTVHVVVDSSAALYEVDRLLRDGLEGDLRRCVKGTLSRVRLSIGPIVDPDLSC